MTKQILIAFSFALVVVAGCSPKLYPIHNVESVTEVRDTVRETVRDTVYYAEPDSTIVELLIECNERGQAQMREIRQLRNSQRAETTVAMTDNKMQVKTVVDSLGIYLQYKERYHSHVSEQTQKETETVIVTEEVNVLYWWQKGLMWCGVAALIILMLQLIRLVIKTRSGAVLTAIKQFFKAFIK